MSIRNLAKCEVRILSYSRDFNFLSSIVIGDEIWVVHYTPETKRQSSEWRHTGSPYAKKFKILMASVFWDGKRIALIDFMPQWETITSTRYSETVQKLKKAIKNKRRKYWRWVCLLLGNAHSHSTNAIMVRLNSFGCGILNAPAYFPDLEPSKFPFIAFLKTHIGRKKNI